jgi:hypothetical protein
VDKDNNQEEGNKDCTLKEESFDVISLDSLFSLMALREIILSKEEEDTNILNKAEEDSDHTIDSMEHSSSLIVNYHSL